MEMRTRLLSKMTNEEVEEYLDRNSIIFVPVGTVELHGKMPLDCEYTQPAGLALAMAEKVDGLVMDGLKYFYCGATTNGKGTVQVSTRAGYDYLKEIVTSLWCQGFKEIILVSGHGPAAMTIVPMNWDFFDETKHHVWWMDQATCLTFAERRLDPERDGVEDLSLAMLGSYEILNCKDDLVIDPSAEPPIRHKFSERMGEDGKMQIDHATMPPSVEHLLYATNFATFSDATGFYFGSIQDHGGNTGAFASIEERDKACAEGLKQLRVCVELMDMPRYIEEIRKQQQYTDTEIKSKYHHLPKNRYADWK